MAYEWIEHTAEVELQIDAHSPREVFEDALAAFAELVADEAEASDDRQRHELRLVAADRASLLVAWLEELIYLAETEGFVPARVARFEAGDSELRAHVEGRAGEPRPLVKAVTYHGLEFARTGDGWRARIVLDV